MLDFVVAGLPVAIVMVALVEVLKRVFHIEGDRAIPVAVGLGIVLSLANHVGQLWPAFAVWYETVMAGLLIGFAACGLFDAAQALKPTRE